MWQITPKFIIFKQHLLPHGFRRSGIWVWLSWVSHKAAVEVSGRAAIIWRLAWVRIHFHFSGCWQVSIPYRLLVRALSQLLQCGLLHSTARNIWVREWGKKESSLREEGVWGEVWQARRRPRSFCGQISEVVPYHFCCISFVRRGSLGSGNTQRGEIREGRKYQEAETTEGILEAAYHSVLGHLASAPGSHSTPSLP